MWWTALAALAFEVGHTEVTVERLTGEMHWFSATAMHVETIGCTVGVPVSGAGQPYVGCWFPGGRIADPRVPKDLRWAARAAREAVARNERDPDIGSPVRDVRVTYEATERRAWVCDHALLPGGLWNVGRVVIGIRGWEAHVADEGLRSGGGESLLGCEGRPIAVDLPDDVDGRSVITAAWLAPDASSKAAFEAILRALPAAIESLPPTPSAPTRMDAAPFGVVWSGRRAQPGGNEKVVYVPEGRIVGTRTVYRFVSPEGVPSEAVTTLTAGLPDDWSVLASPEVPEGWSVRATVEVFATDVPYGPAWTPEARGFERLHTSAGIELR